MTNLLAETLTHMTDSGKDRFDVKWVGTDDGKHVSTWQEFADVANIEYDSGYGGQEISPNLVVVFRDGSWLERAEYDGAEWWELRVLPIKSTAFAPLTCDDLLSESARYWKNED